MNDGIYDVIRLIQPDELIALEGWGTSRRVPPWAVRTDAGFPENRLLSANAQ